MAAPLSLPRLRRGENRLVYTDLTTAPHEVTITHQWQECHAVKPPEPPARPLYPEPGATIRDSLVTFKWPATAGCRHYHLQVSRRDDFRVPYRPSYDVIVAATAMVRAVHRHVRAGHDVLLARSAPRTPAGVWSEWSPAWTFRWEGPRVPLQRAQRDRARGDPAALGAQPARDPAGRLRRVRVG